MIPALPKDDEDPRRRAAAIARARDAYRYGYDHLPGIALASSVPPADAPTAEWVEMVSVTLMKLLVNHAKFMSTDGWACHHEGDHVAIVDRLRGLRSGAIKEAIDHIVSIAMGGDIEPRHAIAIDEFAEHFREIALPRSALVFRDDNQFANMRVAGSNPMQIQRIQALDDRLRVTDDDYRDGVGDDGDSLAAAGAEGRLYLADYAILDGLRCGVTPGGQQKYLSAPLALFAVPRARAGADRHLAPIAIQCEQRPGPAAPVFTPDGSWGWLLAKAHVQAADGNIHQAVRHLAHTHLVMDPIVMATRRQLSARHPLAVLLGPHLEGTLEINHAAWKNLLADGGGVDLVMAGEIGAVRAFVAKAVQDWVFDDAMIPRAFVLRGVDDHEALPHYPYRDQARMLWVAIREWVDGYLRLYYAGDADVQADPELQAWAGEIVSRDGGRVRGFGQGGRIEALDYLIDAATLVVFTASVQHAAVNFPQFQIMSFVPKAPLAVYGPPPSSRAATKEDYLKTLPPLQLAYAQAALGFLLGSVNYTKLGQYRPGKGASILDEVRDLYRRITGKAGGYFEDPRVAAPLGVFQARLAEIERRIGELEGVRFGYDYLLPSKIPQSINI